MCIEQLHVLNVHGAVACAEMCMEQLHVHVIRMGEHICSHILMTCTCNCSMHIQEHNLRTQITPEGMTLKYTHALHSVEAVWQVGPGVVSVFVVDTEDDFLVLC